MDINEEAYAIQEEVVEFRRALHRCPEIAFHETMTMEYIREHLEEWEISYKIFDPSGIIAVVGNGKKETIALRADMDALEVQEETGLDFASLNHGCMHACGHDGHTAILLATAKILKKHESELDRRVYLVFQPAEETAEGARFMLKTGVLDSVKRIYGVHIYTVYRLARFHWKQAQEWRRQTGWQFIYTEDQDMQGNHMKGLILQWQYLPWL